MRWTIEQDNELIKLKRNGVTNPEIAISMKLTIHQVVNRIAFIKARESDDFLKDVFTTCAVCGQERRHKNKIQKERNVLCERQCRKCRSKEMKTSMLGEANPFFGKTHSEETKRRISAKNVGKKYSEERKLLHGRHLNEYARIHPRRSPYEHWLEKFGKEIADQKMSELKIKYSIASTGEKNSMFGRPTPKKAGSGWSGWYNDSFYFRSIRELSFFISAEDSGVDIKSIHLTKEFKVPYKGVNEQNRTYSPDFVIGNEIIEIKPKRLWNTDENKRKFSAAKEFFERIGYVFIVMDVEPDTNKLKEKFLDGKIEFDKKCVDKFKKYCGF